MFNLCLRSDDPAADAEKYYEEQEEVLSKMPKCDYCDEHIQDDFYKINGETICQDCMDSNFRRNIEDYLE